MHNYRYFSSKPNPNASVSVSIVKPVWRQGFAQAELTTPQTTVRTKRRLGEGHAFVMCYLHRRNSFKSSICPKTTGRDQTGWQLAQRVVLTISPQHSEPTDWETLCFAVCCSSTSALCHPALKTLLSQLLKELGLCIQIISLRKKKKKKNTKIF